MNVTRFFRLFSGAKHAPSPPVEETMGASELIVSTIGLKSLQKLPELNLTRELDPNYGFEDLVTIEDLSPHKMVKGIEGTGKRFVTFSVSVVIETDQGSYVEEESIDSTVTFLKLQDTTDRTHAIWKIHACFLRSHPYIHKGESNAYTLELLDKFKVLLNTGEVYISSPDGLQSITLQLK